MSITNDFITNGRLDVPGVLADTQIRTLARAGMIEPFHEGPCEPGTISYGLTSYGYDVRLARNFRVFKDVHNLTVDPKAFGDPGYERKIFEDVVNADFIDIPPRSYVLGSSVERVRVPRGVLALCVGKSTYARCGIIVNVTPLEPEWEGHVTIEISNSSPCYARVYAGEGVMQLVFVGGSEVCGTSYADKKGKYQSQPDRPVSAVVR